jgi:hypothetical protein
MVVASCPVAHQNLAAELKAAVLSVVYDGQKPEDPLERTRFRIDVGGTEFKLAKQVAGSLIYTFDGNIPTQRPVLVVASSMGQVAVADQKQYAINRMRKFPQGETYKIQTTDPITFNGLPGYEIVADGLTKEGKSELLYQLMLFAPDGQYYILVGTTTENREKNLTIFRQVGKTFTRQ